VKHPTPAPATTRFAVALQGFSAFERSALASYFRLAAQRIPAYHQVDSIARADFVIADADQPAAVEAVLAAGRAGDTIFVGGLPPPGALACMVRPIEPRHVQRVLDALAATRADLPPMPANASRSDPVRVELGRCSPPQPAPSAGGGGGRPVLVVDDSGIARKFLAQRLGRFGYAAQMAGSAEQALEMLAEQPYAIVFADVVLGEPGSSDGLALCQQIKRSAARAPVPAVVIVSGHAGAPDRVRGSLAGCDAYLGKPVDEAELVHALRRVDPAFTTA
jgi:two-component system, cell cycle response regulator